MKCERCEGKGKLGCDHPIHGMDDYEGFCDKCSGLDQPYACPDCNGTGKQTKTKLHDRNTIPLIDQQPTKDEIREACDTCLYEGTYCGDKPCYKCKYSACKGDLERWEPKFEVQIENSHEAGYKSAQQKAQVEIEELKAEFQRVDAEKDDLLLELSKREQQIEKSNTLRDEAIDKHSSLTDKYCNLVEQQIEIKKVCGEAVRYLKELNDIHPHAVNPMLDKWSEIHQFINSLESKE